MRSVPRIRTTAGSVASKRTSAPSGTFYATLSVVGNEEHSLGGGWQTKVTRRGDVVFRSSGPQSPAVIALLGYLHEHGFQVAPKPIGTGFAPDGREQLGFIEGTSPQPHPWSAAAAWQIGGMLRRLHDTAASFVPDVAPDWRPWFARSLPGDRPVIGHGDLGPWNILARNGEPVAFIDWDYAGPVDAHWELAEVAWLNAQLHDDDVAERNGLGSPAERARQLALIVDGYGLDRAGRAGLVDRMVEFAIRSARQEVIDHGVGPATASPTADGFPVLWAIAWRARAAAWMIDNRGTLESALDL